MMTQRSLTLTDADSAPGSGLARLWRPLTDRTKDTDATFAEARRRAFDDGFAAGFAQRTADLTGVFEAVETARHELEKRLSTLESAYRARCASVLAEIISAAAPAVTEASARMAVAGIIEESLGDGVSGAVTLTCASDIFELLQRACAEAATAVELSADPDLPPGALKARWSGGGMDCDVGRSLFAIVEFLNAQSTAIDQEAHP